MKTKEKMLKLMEYGLKPKTLSDLSESQINSLYLRLLETNNEVVMVSGKNPNEIESLKSKNKTFKVYQTKELEEKFESKKQQKYFYSKCGDGKTKEQKKWCKMAKEFSSKTDFKKLPEKKKETKEGSNYQNIVKNTAAQLYKNNLGKTLSPQFESKLEKQITKLLEDNMNPKMSKRDFIKLIYEMDAPGTKEKEPITKPVTEPKPDIDFDPFGVPDPNELPSPEAKSPGTKEKEPITKPKPVTEPKPDIDFDPFGVPDPNELPSPEAEEKGFSIFMKQVINKGMLK